MKINAAYVYRIFLIKEFDIFKKTIKFDGNELDRVSGYIHMSRKTQLKETLNKYFKEDDVLIGEFKVDCLFISLRWEVSRNKDLFPHLYSKLKYSWLNKVYDKLNYDL